MWFDRPQLVVEGAVDLSLSQNINRLEAHHPLKENVLKEALVSISKIQYESKDFDDRPIALGKLVPYMAELSHIKLYPLWCETLHLLAYHIREDLLVDLQALISVIVALGGPDALEETAQAIEDVSSWWP